MHDVSEFILSYILYSNEYAKKVLIHLKEEYFETLEEVELFKIINGHFIKYNQIPTKEEIRLDLVENSNISANILDKADELLERLFSCDCSDFSLENMVDKAEQFAKDRSMFLALSKSIEISKDNSSSKLSKTAIPKILSDALSVSFDNTIGHDYFEDFQKRYDFYNNEEEKIEFDLNIMNKCTNGGVPRGTLNLIYAGVNVGKSLSLCHLAASYLALGLNVLYVTMEMSENVTAQRIDANLFNHNINKFSELNEVEFEKKIFNIKKKSNTGRLFVKFYPPLTANSTHVDNLIEELKIKKNGFKPDIIIVDYIGIFGSSTLQLGKGGVNTNTYFKYVSEELRALAAKHDAISWTAQQFNRGGFSSSDPDIDDAAESFGVNGTADFIISLTTNAELMEMEQYHVKVLKTRYYSRNNNFTKFNIGVNYETMKLFDLPESMSLGVQNKIKKKNDFDVINKGAKNGKKINFE